MIVGKTYKGEGSITISRMSGEDEVIRVRIEDETSGTLLCEFEMAPEKFALAVTGQAYMRGQLNAFDAPIGYKHEHKTESVPFGTSHGGYNEVAEKTALKPFEVKGWVGTRSDLHNGHRRNQKGEQSVTFHRYVCPECNEPYTEEHTDKCSRPTLR